MMDLVHNLGLGLGVAFSPLNLLFCLIGALVGTLIGVLPGLGPVATIAILLPVTFYLPTVGAIIMLAGIYYGAQYGGSTTAILVNIPGETSSLVTCIDGYQMARKGRAGAALAIAAGGSFIAGTISTFVIALASAPLTKVALQFGPAEYFSLMVLGLVGAVVLANGSLIKAFSMVFLGLLIGLIGQDQSSGVVRYAFGVTELIDGLGFVPIAMGLLGITEIITNLEKNVGTTEAKVAKIGTLMPTRQEMREAWPAVLRGTVLGSIMGVLPGGGALLSSFASYALEKRISRWPERFGHGAVEGVAGPESANNAGAQTSFIPLLTLGIPSNPTMAVILGAIMIQGIAPGPTMIVQQPQLFWGVIASMWMGNLMLIVINLPLIGMWVSLLKVPYRLFFPSVLLICAVGIYTLDNSAFEVGMTALLGAFGYVFYKLGCEVAPFALGFVLGPLMEENLRRAMLMSHGDPMIFITGPISLGMLIVAGFLLILVILPAFRRTRSEAFAED